MPLDEETLGKLTTTLAGDTDLFNAVINELQTTETIIAEKDNQIQELSTKATDLETRSQEYLGQISNLLSKIPISSSNTTRSYEDSLEDIKNRSWSKQGGK